MRLIVGGGVFGVIVGLTLNLLTGLGAGDWQWWAAFVVIMGSVPWIRRL